MSTYSKAFSGPVRGLKGELVIGLPTQGKDIARLRRLSRFTRIATTTKSVAQPIAKSCEEACRVESESVGVHARAVFAV